MSGNFSRTGPKGPSAFRTYRHAKPGTKPPVPAADSEHEQSQPINRDDRRAMLRRHFEAGGLSGGEIDAHLIKAKV